MFGFLRIIIGIIIVVAISAFYLKFKNINNFMYRISIPLFAIVVITLLGFLPFENLIYNFKSPEAVFNYYHYGEKKVDIVISGKNSDFVIGTVNNSSTYLIVPKTSKGWKIGAGYNTKKVAEYISLDNRMYVYNHKNTNDYFVVIFNVNSEFLELRDSCNSKFHYLEKTNKISSAPHGNYYAHILDFNSEYSVILNGKKYVLERHG